MPSHENGAALADRPDCKSKTTIISTADITEASMPYPSGGPRCGAPMNVTPFPAVKDTWLAQCIKGNNGSPLGVVTNALVALRRDPAIRDAFAFDEMQRTPLLMHPIGQPLGPLEPRAVTDDDVTFVTEWMQTAGLARIGREVVRDAVKARALENSFHPVWQYLQGLKWDGRPRANVWLTTKLGAEATR